MSRRTVTLSFSEVILENDIGRVRNLIEDLQRQIDVAGLGHVPDSEGRNSQLQIEIESHARGEVRTILRKLLANHQLTHDIVVTGA